MDKRWTKRESDVLDRMTRMMRDGHIFTASEVAEWATVVNGVLHTPTDAFIVEVCMTSINAHRDDTCLWL